MNTPTDVSRPRSGRPRLADQLGALGNIARSGFFDAGMVAAESMTVLRWGSTAATAFDAAAKRYPRRAALVDDAGALTYAELAGRTNAIANGLDAAGVGARDVVGLLATNGRGFVQAHLAATKVGADVVLLNTGFAAPQLTDVCTREGVTTVVYSPTFADVVGDAARSRPAIGTDVLEDFTGRYSHRPPGRPGHESHVVLLTSGTTGTPKGAHRDRAPRDPRLVVAMVGVVPYRPGDVVAIPAPLFHAWGFAQYVMAGGRGATAVLSERFDPEAVLAQVDRERVTFLAVVPLMLQRILALEPAVIRRYDHSSLRVVASSGSALPGHLARRWMEIFGDNLYNLYGSTEVGHATIAGPADLRDAPGTAGRPLAGVTVEVLGDDDRPLPAGKVGRIFVGSSFHFDGYTGGTSKPTVGNLMATGDMGSFDGHGRLHVGGRDDDMIVSGGENVFPREVEDLLADHPDISDAGVVGVPDEEFGQRLSAFVVRRDGTSLDADRVRALVRDRLARHKVPRDVTFVDALPRNATGKILRRALVEQATAGPGAAAGVRRGTGTARVAGARPARAPGRKAGSASGATTRSARPTGAKPPAQATSAKPPARVPAAARAAPAAAGRASGRTSTKAAATRATFAKASTRAKANDGAMPAGGERPTTRARSRTKPAGDAPAAAAPAARATGQGRVAAADARRTGGGRGRAAAKAAGEPSTAARRAVAKSRPGPAGGRGESPSPAPTRRGGGRAARPES